MFKKEELTTNQSNAVSRDLAIIVLAPDPSRNIRSARIQCLNNIPLIGRLAAGP